MSSGTIFIATRGSALALAQANMILAECRARFPSEQFELKIIKTTGDKLQTASMSRIDASLPRGLFTKELEVAMLEGQADLAVHSLKDLPTELPAGLKLGATTKREDVRDVLIYRDVAAKAANGGRGFGPETQLRDLPQGATVATSSTRRKAQMLALRPDLNVVEIRGNVGTRLEKLASKPELDATVLAAAGLSRLKFVISSTGELKGDGIPSGLRATILDLTEMLPCVGQGAIGIEIRENDPRIDRICAGLNHSDTFDAVIAERAFLRAMGGGCQAPLGAHASISGDSLKMSVVSFLSEQVQRAESTGLRTGAEQMGMELAGRLKGA